MTVFTKEHTPLIIGIALPILMTVFIAGAIYLPGIFVGEPQYNFVYTYYQNPSYGDRYLVEDGRLIKETVPFPEDDISPGSDLQKRRLLEQKEEARFYIYDVEERASEEVSFEEVQAFMLDLSSVSPAGFRLERNQGHNGIFELFGSSGDRRDFYLAKSGARYSVSLSEMNSFQGRNASLYNFRFLGWTTDQE